MDNNLELANFLEIKALCLFYMDYKKKLEYNLFFNTINYIWLTYYLNKFPLTSKFLYKSKEALAGDIATTSP